MGLYRVTAQYRCLIDVHKVQARNAAHAGEIVLAILERNGEDVESIHATEVK